MNLFSLLRQNRPPLKDCIANAILAAVLAVGVFCLFNGVFHIQLPTAWFDI